MEEVKIDALASGFLKQVTDFTAPVKVDIKHKQPVDATRYCAVIVNTNDNCFDYFNSGVNRNIRTGQTDFDQDVEAVRRRVYVVPFVKKFSHAHKPFTKITLGDARTAIYKDFIDIELV